MYIVYTRTAQEMMYCTLYFVQYIRECLYEKQQLSETMVGLTNSQI